MKSLIIDQHQLLNLFRKQYRCPISNQVITKPVMDMDGITYQEANIVEHYQNSNISPVTRLQVSKELIFNNTLNDLILSVQNNVPMIVSHIKILNNTIQFLQVQNERFAKQRKLRNEIYKRQRVLARANRKQHIQAKKLTRFNKIKDIQNRDQQEEKNKDEKVEKAKDQQVEEDKCQQIQDQQEGQDKNMRLNKRKLIRKFQNQQLYDTKMSQLYNESNILNQKLTSQFQHIISYKDQQIQKLRNKLKQINSLQKDQHRQLQNNQQPVMQLIGQEISQINQYINNSLVNNNTKNKNKQIKISQINIYIRDKDLQANIKQLQQLRQQNKIFSQTIKQFSQQNNQLNNQIKKLQKDNQKLTVLLNKYKQQNKLIKLKKLNQQIKTKQIKKQPKQFNKNVHKKCQIQRQRVVKYYVQRIKKITTKQQQNKQQLNKKILSLKIKVKKQKQKILNHKLIKKNRKIKSILKRKNQGQLNQQNKEQNGIYRGKAIKEYINKRCQLQKNKLIRYYERKIKGVQKQYKLNTKNQQHKQQRLIQNLNRQSKQLKDKIVQLQQKVLKSQQLYKTCKILNENLLLNNNKCNQKNQINKQNQNNQKKKNNRNSKQKQKQQNIRNDNNQQIEGDNQKCKNYKLYQQLRQYKSQRIELIKNLQNNHQILMFIYWIYQKSLRQFCQQLDKVLTEYNIKYLALSKFKNNNISLHRFQSDKSYHIHLYLSKWIQERNILQWRVTKLMNKLQKQHGLQQKNKIKKQITQLKQQINQINQIINQQPSNKLQNKQTNILSNKLQNNQQQKQKSDIYNKLQQIILQNINQLDNSLQKHVNDGRISKNIVNSTKNLYMKLNMLNRIKLNNNNIYLFWNNYKIYRPNTTNNNKITKIQYGYQLDCLSFIKTIVSKQYKQIQWKQIRSLKCYHMKTINCTNLKIGDYGWKVLVQYSHLLTNLIQLNLSHNNITTITKLQLNSFTRLKIINLNHNKLTHQSIYILKSFKKENTHIKVIFDDYIDTNQLFQVSD